MSMFVQIPLKKKSTFLILCVYLSACMCMFVCMTYTCLEMEGSTTLNILVLLMKPLRNMSASFSPSSTCPISTIVMLWGSNSDLYVHITVLVIIIIS